VPIATLPIDLRPEAAISGSSSASPACIARAAISSSGT